MKRRVITTQVTATEEAQLIALIITMLGPLSNYAMRRVMLTVQTYFNAQV